MRCSRHAYAAPARRCRRRCLQTCRPPGPSHPLQAARGNYTAQLRARVASGSFLKLEAGALKSEKLKVEQQTDARGRQHTVVVATERLPKCSVRREPCAELGGAHGAVDERSELAPVAGCWERCRHAACTHHRRCGAGWRGTSTQYAPSFGCCPMQVFKVVGYTIRGKDYDEHAVP